MIIYMWYDMIMYIYIWSDYIHCVLHSMYMYIHLHLHICHGIQKNKHNRTRNIMYSSWYVLLCHPLGAHASAWQKARPWTPSLAELGSNWWRFPAVFYWFPLVSQKHSHYNGLEGSLSICLWMLYIYIYIIHLYHIISFHHVSSPSGD